MTRADGESQIAHRAGKSRWAMARISVKVPQVKHSYS
jgi:hypothetical protein